MIRAFIFLSLFLFNGVLHAQDVRLLMLESTNAPVSNEDLFRLRGHWQEMKDSITINNKLVAFLWVSGFNGDFEESEYIYRSGVEEIDALLNSDSLTSSAMPAMASPVELPPVFLERLESEWPTHVDNCFVELITDGDPTAEYYESDLLRMAVILGRTEPNGAFVKGDRWLPALSIRDL